MSSLASGISVALRAIMANQQAIEVTEHNVANSTVRGYRRQAAVMKADIAYSTGEFNQGLGNGQMGSGVTVDRVMRYASEFFDGRYRQESAGASQWAARRDGLSQLETAMAENTTNGVLPGLDEFWAAWQQLSSDPANNGYRQAVLDEGASLAAAFQSRLQSVNALRAEQNRGILTRVEQVNTIAGQIATLNEDISAVFSHGEQPNDLLDERDRLLDQLSDLSGAVSHQQANGEVIVSIAGQVLVNNHTVYALRTAPKTGDTAVVSVLNSSGQPINITGGEIAGLMDVRDNALVQQRSQLNAMASAVISAVNTAHTGGVDLDGNPGVAFFSGTDASDITVNSAISGNPRAVAAAAASGDSGDGSVASLIAKIAGNPQAALGNQTLKQYYNQRITTLGLDTQRAKSTASQRDSAVSALDAQRESVGGVNLDEEAANLVRYQRAYQAATRLMTAVDEMLDTVINNMGLVGR